MPSLVHSNKKQYLCNHFPKESVGDTTYPRNKYWGWI